MMLGTIMDARVACNRIARNDHPVPFGETDALRETVRLRVEIAALQKAATDADRALVRSLHQMRLDSGKP